MPRLRWNQDPNPKFEFGIDRGVLYPENGVAVPWSGIISATEVQDGDGVSSYYFDGIKYLDTVARSVYQMKLNAFSAPEGFDEALGNLAVVPGFILTKQERAKFGLSYRTKIGNDLGYKIHLVYNAVVKESNMTYTTINATANAQTRSWTIDTVPLDYPGRNPSAHIIFDSTKMDSETLEYLESVLYGSDTQVARLPTIFELSSVFEGWQPVTIDYNDSGFSPLIPGVGDLTSTKTDGILVLIQTSRLGLTSNPGFYRLES